MNETSLFILKKKASDIYLLEIFNLRSCINLPYVINEYYILSHMSASTKQFN